MLSAKDLGELADAWWDAKNACLGAYKVAAALKLKESALEAKILQEMREQEISAVGGRVVRLSMDPTPQQVPVVKNWQKLYEYIIHNDAFELLERRVGKNACKERWAEGEEIPGVEKFPVWKFSKSAV